MGPKIIISCRLCVVVLVALLSGCTIPGTYFNHRTIREPVTVGKHQYYPTIININAQLYVDTMHLKQPSPANALWYQPGYAYRVGIADVLHVTVWDHPELSTPMDTQFSLTKQVAGQSAASRALSTNNTPGILVDSNGSIFFPYVGRMRAAGLTTEEIQKKLTQKLKKYIRDPQVSVRVSAFRSQLINVIGAVKQPGTTPIIDKPLTILEAIANVGGADSATANNSNILIVRGSVYTPLFII